MTRATYLALFEVLVTQVHQATSQPEFRYHYCNTSSNTTANSTCWTNLNTILSNLTSDKQIDYGFYNLSHGNYPNAVYTVGLCRGDVMSDFCHSCLKNSSVLLPLLCPDQKQDFGMYDECMLSYSRHLNIRQEGRSYNYCLNVEREHCNKLEQLQSSPNRIAAKYE